MTLEWATINTKHDEKKYALIGYRSKTTYQLGQKVKIKIKRADLERKQMDFILV